MFFSEWQGLYSVSDDGIIRNVEDALISWKACFTIIENTDELES